jgi:hypothetical protein
MASRRARLRPRIDRRARAMFGSLQCAQRSLLSLLAARDHASPRFVDATNWRIGAPCSDRARRGRFIFATGKSDPSVGSRRLVDDESAAAATRLDNGTRQKGTGIFRMAAL